jgi:hypothetical protein
MKSIKFILRAFALKIKRPFAIRYNPYNSSIEILSNAQQVSNIVSDLKGDICIIFDALKKIETDAKLEKLSEDETNENQKKNPPPKSNEIAENLKVIRQYKKLEKAFQDLSLDID